MSGGAPDPGLSAVIGKRRQLINLAYRRLHPACLDRLGHTDNPYDSEAVA
jgi:hypothetical protein